MYKIGIFAFLMLTTCQIFSQPKGLSTELIMSNRISQVIAFLDMESNDSIFENLEVQNFEFDDKGRCVRKKHIYPFYDVVTTSFEYFFKFDANDNVIEKIIVQKTEALTDKDKEFIGLFGETNDTTVYQYEYDSAFRLLKELEFKLDDEDTLVVEYKYEKSLLKESVHYSTMNKGKLSSNNFTKYYYYDKEGRLLEVRKAPETLNSYSTSTITYLGNTRKKLEVKTINEFRWYRVYEEGNKSIEVSQDSLNGKIEKYEYDNDGNLLKEITFRSLSDFESNFYGNTYKYKNNRLIEEQSFNKSSTVINLTDKIQYEYDSNGLLVKEKMIYDGELIYTYLFKYKKKENKR